MILGRWIRRLCAAVLVAGLARSAVGLVAWATARDAMMDANAWGIPGWMPGGLMLALAALALGTWRRRDTLLQSLAALWAACAWGLAKAPVLRAEWPELVPWWLLLAVIGPVAGVLIAFEVYEQAGAWRPSALAGAAVGATVLCSAFHAPAAVQVAGAACYPALLAGAMASTWWAYSRRRRLA